MAKKKKPASTKKRPAKRPWQEAILEVMPKVGMVSVAARLVGVDRTNVWRLYKRDPEFAKRFDDACRAATDTLELEARRRALEGVDEPLMYQGKNVGYVRKYSDQLLMFLLKGRRPKVYGDRLKVDQKTTVTTIQQGREGLYSQIAERIGRTEESN